MESVNTPRQVYLYLSDLDTVLKTLKDLNVSRGDIPETARLHNAPQQCDAMTLLSGNARNAANKSWTPPKRPIMSPAASKVEKIQSVALQF